MPTLSGLLTVSRFGEKNRTDRARDQGYLFPIRPRNQKLLGKKLTIPKQVRAGVVMPRIYNPPNLTFHMDF